MARIRHPLPPRGFINIYVLLPLHAAYFRDVLRGVLAYRLTRPRWRVFVGEPAREVRQIKPYAHGADGLITVLSDLAWEKQASRLPMPVVNVANFCQEMLVPRVTCDDVAVGQLGAQHLISRGFVHLGFALKRGFHARQRRYGFEGAARRAGRRALRLVAEGYAEYDLRKSPPRSAQHVSYFKTFWWRADKASLRDLPVPVGIMAEGDNAAAQFMESCRSEGLAVPQQVGILGVSNDDLYCESLQPQLTSVDVNGRRIGFEAAGLLDRLLAGASRPRRPILIPPKGVVVRESTDTVAVEDNELAVAMRYIQDHACGPIQLEEVARHAGLSARTLQRRLRKHFGHTAHKEIQRHRFERARQLLAQTDLKVVDVAHRSGYRHFRHFIGAFGRQVGMTPSEYRRRSRLRLPSPPGRGEG
jgi:LacI family transcriptional regulator